MEFLNAFVDSHAHGDNYGHLNDELKTMLLYKRIFLEQLFERQTDRILYGHDLRYAPARKLVKPLLIPPKTKIPKVEFVDVDGTLIQQQELDRRVESSRIMLAIHNLIERGE